VDRGIVCLNLHLSLTNVVNRTAGRNEMDAKRAKPNGQGGKLLVKNHDYCYNNYYNQGYGQNNFGNDGKYDDIDNKK